MFDWNLLKRFQISLCLNKYPGPFIVICPVKSELGRFGLIKIRPGVITLVVQFIRTSENVILTLVHTKCETRTPLKRLFLVRSQINSIWTEITSWTNFFIQTKCRMDSPLHRPPLYSATDELLMFFLHKDAFYHLIMSQIVKIVKMWLRQVVVTYSTYTHIFASQISHNVNTLKRQTYCSYDFFLAFFYFFSKKSW